jgi:hypothetical protein
MLGIARIDHEDLEPALVEQFEDRDPVDPGRLHDHRPHAAFGEPIGQPVEVGRERAEAAHRLCRAIRPDRGHMKGGADIDRRRVRMNHRQIGMRCTGWLFARHRRSPFAAERLGCAIDQLPNRDRPKTSPLSSSQQPMDHVF